MLNITESKPLKPVWKLRLEVVGSVEDKDVERMARKFKLDDHVTSRLTELKARKKRVTFFAFFFKGVF